MGDIWYPEIMSYEADVWEIAKWQKLWMLSMLIAFTLLAVSIIFQIQWMHWPRGIAWATAGFSSFKQGRACKRLGRDPDFCYLRAAACTVIGVTCVL